MEVRNNGKPRIGGSCHDNPAYIQEGRSARDGMADRSRDRYKEHTRQKVDRGDLGQYHQHEANARRDCKQGASLSEKPKPKRQSKKEHDGALSKARSAVHNVQIRESKQRTGEQSSPRVDLAPD